MPPVALAIHCHPDDIEFTYAGTLFLLRQAGCELHYMNVADGSVGSAEISPAEIAVLRGKESAEAARLLGAIRHESICHDLEVFYGNDLIHRVLAVVREAAPDILLVPSPEDYMEDHVAVSRIAVTAAFCRSFSAISSLPARPVIRKDITLYHGMPHGLCDQLRRPVVPDFFVDITSVIDQKEAMLARHESQKTWLDRTQGIGSYLAAMRDMAERVGRMSGTARYAEGWRRHSHLGFSARDADPLHEIIGRYVIPSDPDTGSGECY
jgi:LmbE family N-acetylglucosaminyl deacetylase